MSRAGIGKLSLKFLIGHIMPGTVRGLRQHGRIAGEGYHRMGGRVFIVTDKTVSLRRIIGSQVLSHVNEVHVDDITLLGADKFRQFYRVIFK